MTLDAFSGGSGAGWTRTGGSTSPSGARTDETLKRHLAEDGYCVIPDFLTAAEVGALRAATRRYPELLKGGAPSASYQIDWDGPDRIQQIYNADVLCPVLDAVIRSERTLDFLRTLYGHDVGLYHAKLILKEVGGSEIPWHQDFSYWAEQSEYPCQLNCMVYLDDADEENGCLLVVPGSHRLGLVPHEISATHGAFYAGLPDVDVSAAKPVVGRAGTAIVFGPLLWHGSGPNRSSRPRHSYTAVYTNPLLDAHRAVLSCFFPQEKIKAFSGRGPFGFCPEHYQRRNLWQLAVDHVVSAEWDWIEITDRTFSDGSFEWLSARKDPRSTYRRFEQVPLVASNRDDVDVRAGLIADTLRELSGPFGLVLVDCERAANARVALRAVAPGLRDGTVLVLDNYYDCPGWQWGVYREFQDFVVDERLGFDYLGRAPQQVAIRMTAGAPGRTPAVSWEPVSKGIVYE
jgi:ectoine hydroxylase-related dioxygenase (phytanoyl-CoA dioxygenase family)